MREKGKKAEEGMGEWKEKEEGRVQRKRGTAERKEGKGEGARDK